MRKSVLVGWLCACVLAAVLAATNLHGIDNAALGNEADGTNWAAYGRTFSEQHYSPLRQINAGNVSRLGLAWSLDLSDSNFATTAPIAVDGVIYFSPGVSEVHAVDARSGKRLWRYDPEVYKVAGEKMRASWGTRGLAFWKGKVYLGTRDGRLIAIDAKTGKPVWSAMTVDPDDRRYITGAPRVFNGKVIIGHGGADFGATRGYVTAYDAETGKQLWRFHTVPGDPARRFENPAMEMAAKTWNGEWWKHGGGGTVWNAMTYDPQFNRIYLGTGNGAPWNQKIRSPGGGDNLFLCSIVALDADTGEYVWHYQVNPGETWDFNASMDIELATLEIEGKPRQVILHAPKNGFFYVIDRETGKLISAEKFARVTWAERIDLATGRPVENPDARYPAGETVMWPGPAGAHNWQPMSFNPNTGLVYIPVVNLPGAYSDKGIDRAQWKAPANVEIANGLNFENLDAPTNAGSGTLVAWDPVRQKAVWSVPIAGIQGGGTATTAGNLVFQGQMDGKFRAYAADSGKQLWSFYAANGVIAPPITYSVDGKQYVSVLTGVNGSSSAYGSPHAQFGWQARVHAKRLLTFALDGKAKLPDSAPPALAVPLDDPQFKVDAALAERGQHLFGQKLCLTCHGAGAVASGGAPDLRASPLALNAAAFAQVVKGGILEARGMPRYAELSDSDLESLIHYLRARARQSLAVAGCSSRSSPLRQHTSSTSISYFSKPAVTDGKVLLRMTAVGVTPLEHTILSGHFPLAKAPLVLGNEGAGVVEAGGGTDFPVGSRVMFTGPYGVFEDGAYSEWLAVRKENLCLIPEGVDDVSAAGIPVAYLTAQMALTNAGFQAGKTVLASAIGGSVGNAVTQLARALGAKHAISSTTNHAKAERAKALGFDEVIDTSFEKLGDGVRRITGGYGADIVIDGVGGDVLSEALGALALGGSLTTLGYAAGRKATIDVTNLIWQRASIKSFILFVQPPAAWAKAWDAIVPLLQSGAIKPIVAKTFPLAKAADALRYLVEGRPFGRVVLTI